MRSLFVLAIIVLAGCAGAPAQEAATANVAHASVIGTPQWSIGDYWTFNNMAAGGDPSIVTIVVTGESGGEWIVDTNEQSHALYDAQNDISYLGSVRQSDLAGSQGSDRVQFFDFPLEENKTWRTTWDGRSLDVVVEQADADRALLKAYDGDALYVEYEFSIERGFFEYVTFYDDNGTEAFRMDTSDHGSDYTGTVYRYQVFEPELITAADQGMSSGPYSPEDGVTELAFQSTGACNGAPAGRMGVLFTSREADAIHTPQLVAANQPIHHEMILDCTEGQSEVAQDVVVLDPDLDYSLDHGIAVPGGTLEIIIEPRTLEMIPVG